VTEETTTTPETEAATEAAEPTTVEITAQTMLGELVGLVIDELKAAPDVIQRVTARCTHMVKDAVNLIAADGRDVIAANLEQIAAKDSIKAVCTLAKYDENRHALLDAVGKPVLIVVASSSQFMGGKLPTSEPDQRAIDGLNNEASEAPGETEGDTPVADNTVAAAA
jgi:hypothetical protein